MSRIVSLGGIAGLVIVGFTAFSAPVTSAGGVKVDVCHLNDEGVFRPISVSEKALEAHEGHGDGVPGADVPGMDGYVFGEGCKLVAEDRGEPIAAGCYGSEIYSDLELVGPVGQANNTTGYDTFGGTCTGSPFQNPVTIIQAEDIGSAEATCEALGQSLFGDVPLSDPSVGFGALPGDAWLCT